VKFRYDIQNWYIYILFISILWQTYQTLLLDIQC